MSLLPKVPANVSDAAVIAYFKNLFFRVAVLQESPLGRLAGEGVAADGIANQGEYGL